MTTKDDGSSYTKRINRYIVGCKFLCGCIPVQNAFGINRYIVGCKYKNAFSQYEPTPELIDT